MRSDISVRPVSNFTFIKLISILIIISAIALLVIPIYKNYERKIYYKQVIASANAYALAVSNCYQDQGTLTGCNAGTNNIPAAYSAATGTVANIDVRDGVITVTPHTLHGIAKTDTYVMTPVVIDNIVRWNANDVSR